MECALSTVKQNSLVFGQVVEVVPLVSCFGHIRELDLAELLILGVVSHSVDLAVVATETSVRQRLKAMQKLVAVPVLIVIHCCCIQEGQWLCCAVRRHPHPRVGQ